jgi:ABC-2 type transport system ATP-binding protein
MTETPKNEDSDKSKAEALSEEAQVGASSDDTSSASTPDKDPDNGDKTQGSAEDEKASKFEVVEDKEPKKSPRKELKTGPAMIEARGLSKYYGRFAAISDVSFSIPAGQVVAFLGPNGAGKSTTMKILTGFLSPSSGTARIAGLDVTNERIEAARRIGYMPENGPLYTDMTPRSLLNFIGEARGYEKSEIYQRMDHVIRLCHLEDVIEKPIAKLSKGYRQRVGMAQAFLHDPDVLILDEPTSGLDPNQIRYVRSNIVAAGATKTILLSTHILQEVEAMADRVIFISEGRIVFDGSTEEFMSREGQMDDTFYELTRPGYAG